MLGLAEGEPLYDVYRFD